jgi:hypothetical protein
VMLYRPGPRAKAEFLIFQKRSGTTAPPSSQLEEPQNTEPVLSQLPAPAVRELPSDSLEQELITRGVSREQVRKLLSKTAPGQLISAQIQWGDALIRENRGRIYNPPGFYIYLIRGNVLPPADFLSQVQRSELEPGTQVDKTKPNDLDLQHAYEEYRRDEIDHYIAVQYPPAQYEELLNQIEKRVQKQYRSAALWRPENLRDVAAGILRQEIAMQLNFVTFEQFTGAGHTTIANNATDPLKLPVEGN